MSRDSATTPGFLTPAQAARRAGCGRTRVSNALRDGQLYGIRDNRGRWQLDPTDVDAWAATWRATVSDSVEDSDASPPDDTAATLREDLAAARATIVGLEARLADRDAEIDRLDAALYAALQPRPTLLERLLPGRIRGAATSSSGV